MACSSAVDKQQLSNANTDAFSSLGMWRPTRIFSRRIKKRHDFYHWLCGGGETGFPRNILGRFVKKLWGMGRCFSVLCCTPKHFILPLQGEVNANSLLVENLSIQHPQVSAGRSWQCSCDLSWFNGSDASCCEAAGLWTALNTTQEARLALRETIRRNSSLRFRKHALGLIIMRPETKGNIECMLLRQSHNALRWAEWKTSSNPYENSLAILILILIFNNSIIKKTFLGTGYHT